MEAEEREKRIVYTAELSTVFIVEHLYLGSASIGQLSMKTELNMLFCI